MASSNKILKSKGVTPNELEQEVAKAIFDIENAPGAELKADLREFKFCRATEMECPGAKKSAIIVFLPYVVHRESKKFLPKLLREMEKKFQKKSVVFVANRTILDKNFRRRGHQVRPRTRTLTSVHEAMLEDVVYPTEIVGKRTLVKTDGTKILKVFLDKKEKDTSEEKLSIFATVYKQLTNKEAVFTMQ